MSERLLGKTAVITGGASGIGAAIVARFKAEGATTYVADLAAPDEAESIRLDVTDERSVEQAFDRVVAETGRLDICVANAGVSPSVSPVVDLDLATWQRVLDVNLTGSFLTLRGAARRMLKLGDTGRLIATGSVASVRVGPGGSAYGATKFALRGLVSALALELAPKITVNVISPGDTDTPMNTRIRGLIAEMRSVTESDVVELMESRIPVGRLAQPDEIASAYAFLASDEAAYITGSLFVVDGGRLLR
jgi:3-oxoacyl-[acyl-carrier protein] reductase